MSERILQKQYAKFAKKSRNNMKREKISSNAVTGASKWRHLAAGE